MLTFWGLDFWRFWIGLLFFWVGWFLLYFFLCIILILSCWKWNKFNTSHKIIPYKYLGVRIGTREAHWQKWNSQYQNFPHKLCILNQNVAFWPFTKKPCNSVQIVSKTAMLTTLCQINMPQIYIQYLRNFHLLLNQYKSTDEFNQWSYLLTHISDYLYPTPLVFLTVLLKS